MFSQAFALKRTTIPNIVLTYSAKSKVKLTFKLAHTLFQDYFFEKACTG